MIFVPMELEIRNQLQGPQPVDLLPVVTPAIKNEVLFYWSMLSAVWNGSPRNTLLDMVINTSACIYGFTNSSKRI